MLILSLIFTLKARACPFKNFIVTFYDIIICIIALFNDGYY
ncbi:hypothetical protein FN3523_1807 [Francisella hispaniensis]|uniref:Uncharacterized protein n=1 Tax=Francisella hispaniensis TaxID=622488 RepID=F4BI16_9GAMM|nr:hypothetical protein FN3523_1807 [Francisella hispaniensis]